VSADPSLTGLDDALLTLVRAHHAGLPIRLPSDTDWCGLLHKAHRQKTALLAYHTLAHDPSGVPPDIWAKFSTWYINQRRKNGFFALHLRRILSLLDEAGIPALVIKGLALAIGAHGRIDGRTFDDIDLLIPPEHINRAYALMRAQGFVPYDPHANTPVEHEYHHSLTHPRWHISLELHWRAAWRQFNHRAFPVHFDTLFAEARAVPLLNSVMLTPSPAHTFVLLAIDTLKERRVALGRLYDAARVLCDPSLDQAAMWAFAHAAGAQVETAALAGAAAAVGGFIPPPLPEDRYIARARAKLLHDGLQERAVPMLHQLWFYWSIRRTAGERAAFARAVLFDRANRSFFALTILRDTLGALNRRLHLRHLPGGERAYRLMYGFVHGLRARASIDFYRK
jgi:hypothetical protein